MMGARDRLEAEQAARAWAVWHTAALSRLDGKDFPSLRKFIGGRDRGPQDPGEIQMMFDMIATAWGAVTITEG